VKPPPSADSSRGLRARRPAGRAGAWPGLALALGAEAGALGALTAVGDPAARPAITLALLGAATGSMLLLVRAARALALGTGPLLAIALLLRALLLPLPPTLSGDVWRYLWEGRVAAAGRNPYLDPPEDPTLAPLRDTGWRRVEHREVPAIYPPLAMTAMSLVARLRPPLRLPGWKLLVTAADLIACWLLLRLARATGRPVHRALAYAANPLVALEVAGMGHLEPLGVAAALGAGLAVAGRRPVSGGVAAAAAVLAKLAPVVAWPMWARQSGRPAALLGSAGLITAVALAPVIASTGGVPAGLAAYAVRWEFAGPLHEPLWRLLLAADASASVKHALDLMKEWTNLHALWNRFYPWAYPQLMARALLGVVGLVVIVRSAMSPRSDRCAEGRVSVWRDPVAGAAALFGALLLLSPTLYPWYLLWVLPWAALAGQARWLWAAAAAPLAYLPATAGAAWWPWLHLASWGPFLLLWWYDRRCAGA
jgi:hypothetical protein